MEALSLLTIPIPLIAQNLFADNPKFLNSLIESIKESVKGIQVELHPGCITRGSGWGGVSAMNQRTR